MPKAFARCPHILEPKCRSNTQYITNFQHPCKAILSLAEEMHNHQASKTPILIGIQSRTEHAQQITRLPHIGSPNPVNFQTLHVSPSPCPVLFRGCKVCDSSNRVSRQLQRGRCLGNCNVEGMKDSVDSDELKWSLGSRSRSATATWIPGWINTEIPG